MLPAEGKEGHVVCEQRQPKIQIEQVKGKRGRLCLNVLYPGPTFHFLSGFSWQVHWAMKYVCSHTTPWN